MRDLASKCEISHQHARSRIFDARLAFHLTDRDLTQLRCAGEFCTRCRRRGRHRFVGWIFVATASRAPRRCSPQRNGGLSRRSVWSALGRGERRAIGAGSIRVRRIAVAGRSAPRSAGARPCPPLREDDAQPSLDAARRPPPPPLAPSRLPAGLSSKRGLPWREGERHGGDLAAPGGGRQGSRRGEEAAKRMRGGGAARRDAAVDGSRGCRPRRPQPPPATNTTGRGCRALPPLRGGGPRGVRGDGGGRRAEGDSTSRCEKSLDFDLNNISFQWMETYSSK
jgi:hypothetical protein